MGNLNTLLFSLRNWWQTAPAATRALATGLALFVVVGLCFAGYVATAPDYTPIYHGVSGKDAAAIETALREKSITMKFSDNGTVSVPAKDASNATMYVEAAGVLSKNSEIDGISELDKISMGTSTDVEQKRILAADEGELAQKLMGLDPIATAAVTISPGSNTDLFAAATPPTASVIVGLKPGDNLNTDQVKGIVNLVSHAVSGLTPQNVALTDQTGMPLWKDNGAGGNAMGDGQPLDESNKYAEMMRTKVQDMLDSTLGPRKAIVTINADLNFDQSQTHSITHSPVPGAKTGLPISVRDKTESMNGNAGQPPAAPAGSASNLTTSSYTAGASGSGGGAYKTEDTTTNYENDTEDTVTQHAPGEVKGLTVAAMVDTSVPVDEVSSIQSEIEAAIGKLSGDSSRSVTVKQIKFDTSTAKAAADQLKSATTQQMIANVSKTVSVCLVACILLWLLMRSSGGSVGSVFRGEEEPRLAMVGAGSNIGLLENVPENMLDSFTSEEPPLRVEDVLAEMPEPSPRPRRRRTQAPSIEEHQDLKLESIQDMIGTNAEAVALLLKGWMAEETRFSNRD